MDTIILETIKKVQVEELSTFLQRETLCFKEQTYLHQEEM
jgi:hypothetical protein